MGRPRIALDETVIYNLALHGCSRSQIAAICGVHVDTIRDNFESIVRDGHRACTGSLLSKAMTIAHNEPKPTLKGNGKKPYGEKVQATMLIFLLSKLANISPDIGKVISAQPGFDAEDGNAADPDALDDDQLDERITFIMGEVRRSGAPLRLPSGVAIIEGDVPPIESLRKRKSKPAGAKKGQAQKGGHPGTRPAKYKYNRKKKIVDSIVDNGQSMLVHVEEIVHA